MPLRDNLENDEDNTVFPFPSLWKGTFLDLPKRRIETGEYLVQRCGHFSASRCCAYSGSRLLSQDAADEEHSSWFHVASPGVLSGGDFRSPGTLSMLLPLCGEQTVQVGTPQPESKRSPGDGNPSPSIRLDDGGAYGRYLWEEIRLDETKALYVAICTGDLHLHSLLLPASCIRTQCILEGLKRLH